MRRPGGWVAGVVGVLLGVLPSVLLGAAAQAVNPAANAPLPGQWRCGWFENPTPANAWLSDRHGQWLVGVQGGHQAEGEWPRFSPVRWVRTNGHYGYGCACLRVEVDATHQTIVRIHQARSRPLRTCRHDQALKAPESP